MLYRSNTLRVLCPVILIATLSGTPARTRPLTAGNDKVKVTRNSSLLAGTQPGTTKALDLIPFSMEYAWDYPP